MKPADLAMELARLKPRGKEPNSARVLDSWIAHIENSLETDQSGRLSWLVASTLVTAMLQQVIDETHASRFLLKGGSLLQHRLGHASRATKDVDGMVRGDINDFLKVMDSVLERSWGPICFARSDIETINAPSKVVKPRRFEVSLLLRGKTWRRITVEISPDEGFAAKDPELFAAPQLGGIGLPSPDFIAGLSLAYQIAQKIHASTDPHDPPNCINERARDVIDLLLLKGLVEKTGEPSSDAIQAATLDIFAARAQEARQLSRLERSWPAKLVAYPHWANDYRVAAAAAGVSVGLEDAVATLNGWFDAFC